MENIKTRKWNILLPFLGNELSDVALQEAISLCNVFNAGMVLFCPNASDENKLNLAKIESDIRSRYQIKVESYAPAGKLSELLFALALKTESILILIGHNKKNTSLGYAIGKTLRILRKSLTPFIMIPQAMHSRNYKDIAYAMGYQKQEKEKILWASYFGRIYSSNIHVVIPKADDQYFKTGINGNMMTMQKLYGNLDINYFNIPLPYNIHKIYKEALIYSAEKNIGAFLTLTTLRPDIFDVFGGTHEKNLICNLQDIPVLCINPRDDLYVLCN